MGRRLRRIDEPAIAAFNSPSIRGRIGKIGQGLKQGAGKFNNVRKQTGLKSAIGKATGRLMRGAGNLLNKGKAKIRGLRGPIVPRAPRPVRALPPARMSAHQEDLILFRFPSGKLASQRAEFARRRRRRSVGRKRKQKPTFGGHVGKGAAIGAGVGGSVGAGVGYRTSSQGMKALGYGKAGQVAGGLIGAASIGTYGAISGATTGAVIGATTYGAKSLRNPRRYRY